MMHICINIHCQVQDVYKSIQGKNTELIWIELNSSVEREAGNRDKLNLKCKHYRSRNQHES